MAHMCASPRTKSTFAGDCMPGSRGGGGAPLDMDVKQQLMYMQMSMKDIAASVMSLERKVDTTNLGLSSVERQLLQIKQMRTTLEQSVQMKHQETPSAPTIMEIDNLLKKTIDAALSMQAEHMPKKDSDHLVSGQQMESLHRLEQGVNEILSKSMSAMSGGAHETKFPPAGMYMQGASMPSIHGQAMALEGKAGASDIGMELQKVQTQVREELGMFQNHFQKTIQQSLMQQEKTIQMQQETLLREFKQLSSAPQPQANVQSQYMNAAPQQQPQYMNAAPQPHAQYMNPAPAPQAWPQHVSFQATKQDDARGQSFGGSSIPDMSNMMVMQQEPAQSPAPAPDEIKRQTSKGEGEMNHALTAVAQEIHEDDDQDGYLKHIVLKDDSSLSSVFMNDDDMNSPPYHVEDFYWKTGVCQKIARSDMFANVTLVVVIFNALYIGVDSDWNRAQNIYDAEIIFLAISQFFCVYFTFEVVVRFLAFEHKRHTMKDGWFKFDTFLVSTMILDTWILMPTLYVIGGSVTIPTQPLRMLRLFKLTRMARLMKAFPELVIMIKGLVRSLRAMGSSMIFIILMVYVWSIMIHTLMKDEVEFNTTLWEEQSLSFETIIKCIWTLLMDGTLMLDNAAPLMTELVFSDKLNYILAGWAFISYAFLSALLILQMLIGVLCEIVSKIGEEQRDATAIGLVKQELLSDLKRFDGGDNKISQEELLSVMNNPRSKALLKRMNINRPFLLELQRMLFPKPGIQVTIKAVLELMIMCRGENPATVESMSGGILSIINEMTQMKDSLKKEIIGLEARMHTSLDHKMNAQSKMQEATLSQMREASAQQQYQPPMLQQQQFHPPVGHFAAMHAQQYGNPPPMGLASFLPPRELDANNFLTHDPNMASMQNVEIRV